MQRQVAREMEIDTPRLSKIERGDRKAKKEQVFILARLLEIKPHQFDKLRKKLIQFEAATS